MNDNWKRSENHISLGPPVSAKWWAVLGTSFCAFLVVVLAREWHGFTWLGRIWVGGGVLLIGISTIDMLQRRYEIEREKICIRRLFLWTSRKFPPNVEIASDKLGHIIVRAASSKRPIAKIPRIYNPSGVLLARLTMLVHGAQR